MIDFDWEGEVIFWYIFEVLNKKGLLKDKDIEWVVFNVVIKLVILDVILNFW